MKFLLSILMALLITQNCFADWPVKRKRVQLIPSYSYYRSSGYFNNQGIIKSLGSGNSYVSHYLSLYYMYGITDRLDLLIDVPVANQRLTSGGVLSARTGIADISMGLAYHFPSEDLKKFVTLKALFILPAYQNNISPYLGYGSSGYKLAVAYSYNPSSKTYFGGEANYTRYFDKISGPSQYTFTGTFGYYLNDFEKIIFTYTHQLSVSDDKSFSNNLAVNKDFVIGRMTLGYGRRISKTFTPYLQFNFTPYGYNTGSATGVTLYATIKLPW